MSESLATLMVEKQVTKQIVDGNQSLTQSKVLTSFSLSHLITVL